MAAYHTLSMALPYLVIFH